MHNPALITRNVRRALVAIKKSDIRVPHVALDLADNFAPWFFAVNGRNSRLAAFAIVSAANDMLGRKA